MKFIKYSLLILLSTFCVALLSAELFFQPQVQRFVTNVQKYTTININKNWGWRKNVLISIDAISELYPKHDLWNENYIARTKEELFSLRDKSKLVPNKLPKNSEELIDSIKNAQPGDVIELYPHEYEIPRSLVLQNNGSLVSPITLQGSPHGKTTLKSARQVGMKITGANWVVRDLIFEGICIEDSDCEHAIQIIGDADNTVILQNEFKNFNSSIKSNGMQSGAEKVRMYPDNVIIKLNSFVNEWSRDTSNSVTSIDVVGGNNWVVIQNFIADFEKKRGNTTSFGAFLKGGGNKGMIEQNFVACSWRIPYATNKHVRVALSFGGGSTEAAYCQSKDCEFEHKDGQLSENLIVNCPTDVGVYINKSININIERNTVLHSLGIDLDRQSKNIVVTNNKLHGNIRWRNESTGNAFDNVILRRAAQF